MLKHPLSKSYFIILLGLFLYSFVPAQEAPSHDPLSYKVSVTAKLIPVFAVDKDGNPVYDIKQNELQLYVDGKKVDILALNAFSLEMQERGNRAAAKEKQPVSKAVPKAVPKAVVKNRLKFIIIDSLISNVNTLGISRIIAGQLIRQALPGDAFVIMESNKTRGFQYIIGPEKNKQKLFTALKKIKKRGPIREFRSSHLRAMASRMAGNEGGSSAAANTLNAIAANQEAREREQYQKDITRFSVALERLKYALKSTTLPKTVYLISPGVMNYGLGKMPVTSLRFLEDAAKSVNYGGSLFYLINPIPRKKEGRDWGKSLRFMADAAGGKYISGKTVKDIAKKVRKSTSAYYEMAFMTKTRPGQRSRIEVKCSREGVKLTTIANSEQDRPYALMKGLELKLFVLNIVKNGGWSRRILNAIEKTGFQLLKENKSKDNEGNPLILKDIRVSIPPLMRNKTVHLYQVELDNTTEKVSISAAQKQVKQTENFHFKCRDGKSYYIVLIDPSKPSCVYSQVI